MSELRFSLDLGDLPECHEFDPLTGMLTRQTFLQRLTESAQVAADALSPFSICIADVDQLRNVNDQYGQRMGDTVLLAVANRFREVLATTARHPNEYLLARYDGNSFLLLIQTCDTDQASVVAEQLRHAVAENSGVRAVPVTVSVGIAQYRIGEPTDETLARAEQALNLAKQSGRDRVEIIKSPKVADNPSHVAMLWDRTA